MPILPISIHNRSPTASHRSFKLPPDGYIPTIGANSVISLPPPHELSIPVPPASAFQPSATTTSSDSKQERKDPSSEQTDRESRKRTPPSFDGDSTFRYTLSRQPHNNSRHKQPTHRRPMSEASGASTSSLLGPPHSNDIGRKDKNEAVDYLAEGANRIRSMSRASTQFERIASKRRANPDMKTPPSPTPSFLDNYNESTSKKQGNFIIEVSSSFHFCSFIHNFLYHPASNIH
jgi:hypothetical protein